jgi:hypothetical protein
MEAIKNVIRWIVFAVFLFAISCPVKADSDLTELAKKVQPATAIVYVLDQAGKPVAQGSGFFFRYYGHLITNYHVLGKAARARVRTPDGKEFDIKSILSEDETDDLIEALVDVPYGSVPCLIEAGTVPRVGDPVMVIGSPMGVDKVVSQGNVNSIMEIPRLGRCIVHSAHSFRGSSGSPLVNAQGQVIGIETAALVGRPDINFAIPVERFSGLSPNYREFQVSPIKNTTLSAGSEYSGVRSEALKEDIRMAESGDPAAEVRLASRYEQGQDLSRNCFEAFSLYHKAADQGNLPAQYSVGRMYYSGECMGKNLAEAAKWLSKAAERGFPAAQLFLGKMFFNGEGVARDRVAACMWIILAASKGVGEANNFLRFMAAELTQEEFKMAQEKARNWRPVP